MAEFQLDFGGYVPAQEFRKLPAFVRGYIEAMFFTDTGTADDDDLEGATFAELAPATLTAIVAACVDFESRAADELAGAYEANDYDEEQAGRDFWFTRNCHGGGFWDRPQLAQPLADKLTRRAHEFGEVSLYRGDDGKLYVI